MRDFSDNRFVKLLEQVNSKNIVEVDTCLNESDYTPLMYFFGKNYYYAVIVDDYPFDIIDKESLLEALWYQVRLVTVHDLNWDAVDEGLAEILKNFSQFDGILLLFRRGVTLKNKLPTEFMTLFEIIRGINQEVGKKGIKVLM